MRINLWAAQCLLLLVSLFVFAHPSSAQIQSVTAASGASLQGENVSVSFTLGESVINTLQNSNLKVTQGFHQTKLVVTAIDAIENLAVKIEAYPNPVSDNLNFTLSEMLSAETRYALYDSYGGLILEKQLDDLNTSISFQNLVSAVYILRVSQGTSTVKTFKIIKR